MGISGLLEENELALAVENRNGNSPTIPAKQVAINQFIGNAAIFEIAANSVWEILVELAGQVRQVSISVYHAARVAPL